MNLILTLCQDPAEAGGLRVEVRGNPDTIYSSSSPEVAEVSVLFKAELRYVDGGMGGFVLAGSR